MTRAPVCFVHWGQSGGGTRFHLEVSRAAVRRRGAAVSFNANSDQALAMRNLGTPQFRVRTYRSKVGVVLGLPRLLVTALRFRRFIRAHQIQHVVATMESIYQSLAIPIALPRRVTYTTVIHDALQHPGDEHFAKRLGRRLELWRADDVVVLSAAVAEQLVESRQVEPGSVTTLFHPAYGEVAVDSRRQPRSRPAVVGTFGRLLEYKGIDLFVGAIRILTERGVPVLGRVAGAGPEGRWAEESADLPIEWRLGWIAEDDVDDLVASHDILVAPYREASQSGIVAHGLSAGIPLVVTPVGGLREQVSGSGAGLVSEAVSAEAVADAIEVLIHDSSLYENASKAAIDAAKRLSWTHLAESLLGNAASPSEAEGSR